MPDLQTMRPTAVWATTGTWTAEPSGTLWGVTSDDSDATYAEHVSVGTTDTLTLLCGTHTPPADHERHRVRLSARLQRATGVLTQMRSSWRIDPAVGSVQVLPADDSIETVLGSWQYTGQAAPLPAEVPQSVLWEARRPAGFGGTLRVMEAYLEVDSRTRPSFTADVLDGSGSSQAGSVVTDTSLPFLVFDGLDYDDLLPRIWRVAVYTLAQTMAVGFEPFVTSDPVFEAFSSGSPPVAVQLNPLDNDDYVAYMVAFSTIRVDDPFASDIESVAFEVDFIPPPPPDNLTATPTANPPSVEVCWDEPALESGDTEFDDTTDVVVEVQRSDCGGDWERIYVAQDEMTGCHTDRFMPLSGEGVFCGDPDHDCAITYRARYWGYVDDILVTTDWSETTPFELDNPTPGNAWIRGPISGDLSICPDESWTRTRPFGSYQPVAGGTPTVVTGAPGGRDYSLTIPTKTLEDLTTLEAILAAPLVFYQPKLATDLWMAPNADTVEVLKVGRIRVTSVSFVAVEPQPLATPESFFA